MTSGAGPAATEKVNGGGNMPPGDGEMSPRVPKTGLRQSEVQPLREDGRGHRELETATFSCRSELLAGEKSPGTVGGGAVHRDGAPRAAEAEPPLHAGTGQPPAQAPALPQRSVCSCGIRVSAGSGGSAGSWKVSWEG